MAALDNATRYWTLVEYNTKLPVLAGGLLGNRLCWLGLGLVLLAWSYSRFSYSRATAGRWWSRRRTAAAGPATSPATAMQAKTVPAAQRFSAGTGWRQLLRQTRLETATVMRGIPFIIFLMLGLTFVLFSAYYIGRFRGTPVYPVTHLMLQSVNVAMGLCLLIVIMIYSGELVWRERTLRLNEVHGALPVPGGVFLGAKLLTLVLVVGVFLLAGIVSTIAFQISQGYFHLQPGLYVRGFFIMAWPLTLLAVLALFLQNRGQQQVRGLPADGRFSRLPSRACTGWAWSTSCCASPVRWPFLTPT